MEHDWAVNLYGRTECLRCAAQKVHVNLGYASASCNPPTQEDDAAFRDMVAVMGGRDTMYLAADGVYINGVKTSDPEVSKICRDSIIYDSGQASDGGGVRVEPHVKAQELWVHNADGSVTIELWAGGEKISSQRRSCAPAVAHTPLHATPLPQITIKDCEPYPGWKIVSKGGNLYHVPVDTPDDEAADYVKSFLERFGVTTDISPAITHVEDAAPPTIMPGHVTEVDPKKSELFSADPLSKTREQIAATWDVFSGGYRHL
jgi:hypothetical protein